VRLVEALRDLEEPTIRDRPVVLLAIAVGAAIAAVLIGLAAVELFVDGFGYTDWAVPRIVSNEFLQGVSIYPEHYIFMGAILAIPTAFLAALAIGIARARPWAWILGFIAGGLVGLYGVLALVIPGNAAANADRWHLGESVPWIALGAFTLWYFNRRAVRRDLGMGDPALG
jgi:hypothetical protein